MALKRMDNVGIVVDDLAATIEFFRELGLELEGRATIEGEWAGRVTGLGDQRVEIAMMRTPDGHGRLELSRFLTPPTVADHRNAPVNALGYLRVMFAVDDLDETLERLRRPCLQEGQQLPIAWEGHFANTSNGLVQAGQSFPRSNVEFDTNVSARQTCDTFGAVRWISLDNESVRDTTEERPHVETMVARSSCGNGASGGTAGRGARRRHRGHDSQAVAACRRGGARRRARPCRRC